MENTVATVSLKKSASRIGLAAVAMLVAQQIVVIIAAVIIEIVYPDFLNQSYGMWLLSYIPLYLVGVPIFLLIVKGLPHTDIGKEKVNMPLPTFIKWWFICMATMYIFNIVSVLINLAIGMIKGSDIMNPVVEMQQSSGIIYNIIFGVIVAPIGEELLFRHVLYKKLSGFGDKAFMFTSAFIFACIHGNLSQLLYAFALGIIFAYIMARTRKVIYCIAMHVVINAYGMVLSPLALGNEVVLAMLGTTLLAVVIFGIILFIRTKKKGFIIDEPVVDTPARPVSALLATPGMIAIAVVGIALCLITILS